jgi:hypothetical protein
MANNQDLYKQAIAEAKSIRETAVANAKLALEETLTPHIKSLLAAKLQEMEEEEADEVVTEEEEMDEMQGEKGNHEKVDEAEDKEAEDEEAEDDSEESEDEAGEGEAEEEIEVKDMEVEDLKNLIRDIVAQEMGGMDGMEDEMDMDMGVDGGMEGDDQPVDMVGADDEEIDLDELLAELHELSGGDEPVAEAKKAKKAKKGEKEEDEKAKKMKKDLDEALNTIQTLRSDLSEVNLLNAKLLYLNKIFRATNLTEAQKASAISAFDKAGSTKEVKLVYETLKEGFVNTKRQTIKEHKGFASKAAGVAPKKEIISEVSEQIRRMQKLAGII